MGTKIKDSGAAMRRLEKMTTLPWHEVMSARADGSVITAYCFGPCLMLVRRSKGTVQVTREYLFEGKSFRREADMVKYLDGMKRARR